MARECFRQMRHRFKTEAVKHRMSKATQISHKSPKGSSQLPGLPLPKAFSAQPPDCPR